MTAVQNRAKVTRNPGLPKAGLAVIAGALVLIVVGGLWVATRPSGPSAGPMTAVRSGLSAAAHSRVGEHWSWSLIQLENPTDEAIHLDGITVQSSDSRFIGEVLVEQWRQTGTGKQIFPNLPGDGGVLADWPPSGAKPGDLTSPSKAVIPPHKKVYVYVELTPPAKGQFLAGPATLSYSIGDHHYQVTSRNWERMCAPFGTTCSGKGMPY